MSHSNKLPSSSFSKPSIQFCGACLPLPLIPISFALPVIPTLFTPRLVAPSLQVLPPSQKTLQTQKTKSSKTLLPSPTGSTSISTSSYSKGETSFFTGWVPLILAMIGGRPSTAEICMCTIPLERSERSLAKPQERLNNCRKEEREESLKSASWWTKCTTVLAKSLYKIRGWIVKREEEEEEDMGKVKIVHQGCKAKKGKKKAKAPKTPKVEMAKESKENAKKPRVIIGEDLQKLSSPDVYILQLTKGKIYVGKSNDKERRIQQHLDQEGAGWTKTYKFTGKTLPRLGNVRGGGDAAERDETLRYMYKYGIENVRGWKYVQVHLSSKDKLEAEGQIRELFDLCRRCGERGHFMGECKNTKDRLGNPLGTIKIA